ncbi:ATP-dependent DNA helicase RecG [Kiloniella spongiae]|uniref:ATP-dependent DNA helicase RecG n=1 Tax=Kiloniella spongiae TaxID=1489064 RepID=A0A0H2MFY5_9PROT|nr:ATP-dependent DNA helicase RecG [Kiloniella spongiae]KLN61419.1 ATP-dependent DNA helicase RecG [Kiloniella spongiae]
MRPEILFPLFTPVSTLQGVGPRLSTLYEKLAGGRVLDLCWHLPVGLVDRRYSPTIADAISDRVATLKVTVSRHIPSPNRRSPYRVICHDLTGEMTLIFFHARGDYIMKLLPVGEDRIISGKLERFGDVLQMAHPDHMVPPNEEEDVKTVEPVYPLSAGVTLKPLSKAIKASLALAPVVPEWLDSSLKEQESWLDWHSCLQKVHHPQSEDELTAFSPYRKRLAYDELLANQLAISLVREQQTAAKGRIIKGDGSLRGKMLDILPFTLTGSQDQSIREVIADMESSNRMLRLVQGDVGSGKTAVALFPMLAAIESGFQAALMAPTEILARQHYKTLQPFAEKLGISVVILTGRDKGKARKAILESIADGSTQMVIGTHALFQDEIDFSDLALAVIDEQHRFGVHQRLSLARKGAGVDMLVMTATPIPRTLMLTAYGDMAVSRLTEKPAGRQPVDTRTVSVERINDVINGVARSLDQETKVYWVCPLVEDSDKSDLAAAEERYRELSERFGDRVGLVHGRMKGAEKNAVMEKFSKGNVDLLIATTVIEVGVDVPQATIMVIEHAERFGLAQLHQLRGRIGRGSEKSTCILMYQGPLGETSKARLKIMRDSDDGFVIAEEDLRLRGAGEVLGTRQSGLPEFKVADLACHGELLATARNDAKLIMDKDPTLQTPRGEALRTLLYLFERDTAVKYLKSG